MSDVPPKHDKKPDSPFDEKTAVTADPAASNHELTLNLDDDVDENFSFDQKTVVDTSGSKPSMPQSIRISKTAVKIDQPEVAPGDELEFEKKRKKKTQAKAAPALPPVVQKFLQNKRAIAGAGGFLVLFVIFGVWKSHQPRKLDLHLDESATQASLKHDETSPPPGTEAPTAEQVAGRFESVFQKVQSESGDVSR